MTRFAIGAATVLALLAMSTVRADDAKESAYYPLKKGTTWTYKVKDDNTLVTVKVTASDKDGTVVESSIGGMVKGTEKILVKDDGIYRTEYDMQKADVPLKIFKLPAKKDDSWDVDSKIAGTPIKGKFTTREEDITVAAGKYKAIVVEGKDLDLSNGNKLTETFWYVENVGIVKMVVVTAKATIELELAKFEEGK
jgi:hypothetical protein